MHYTPTPLISLAARLNNYYICIDKPVMAIAVYKDEGTLPAQSHYALNIDIFFT